MAAWEYVHVAVDDHSRIAFSAIYPDEKRQSVLAFLAAALDYYARLGIRFRAVLTPIARASSLSPAVLSA